MFIDFKKLIDIDIKYKIVHWRIEDRFCGLQSNMRHWNTIERKILYAGRIDENKNLELLIEAIRKTKNLNLTIIGNKSRKQKINNMILRFGLKDRVQFKEFMPRAKLWKDFDKYDSLIVCSKEIEAFCLVAIEAQTHGLPVIYSNTGALAEVIGDTGLQYISNNVDSLISAIENAFSSRETLTEHSFKGINNTNRFKISNTINNLEKLTKEIIEYHLL